MAHTGLLKPRSRRPWRVGFLWGSAIAFCLTLAVAWLNKSEYSAVNDFVFNLSRSTWRVFTIPGAVLGLLVGMSPEFNPSEPELRDLALMIVSNCLIFGVVGAVVYLRIARVESESEVPQLSRSEKMFLDGISKWVIYRSTIFRRGLWGSIIGLVANLIVLGIAFAKASGHSLSGLFIWWFSQPTFFLHNAMGFPKNHMPELTSGYFFLLCLVNTVLIGLVIMFITAITETWVFFRKR
ncbi:MAG TPA: hypothetical protein VFZ59_22385 [Verrucomicrobiae bacterium]|nr:hypothetical protein [Verrucomicrobiae bacterium]